MMTCQFSSVCIMRGAYTCAVANTGPPVLYTIEIACLFTIAGLLVTVCEERIIRSG